MIRIVIFFLAYSLLQSCGQTKTQDDKSLEKLVHAQSQTIDSLQKIINKVQREKEADTTFGGVIFPISDFEWNEYRKQGIKNPPADLYEDLRSKPSLIPYPGDLGGTMYYEGIAAITSERFIAYFTDGHVSGAMILSCNVEKGKITWKILDKYID